MSISFYELLGVDPGAPADEIKRAFRREIAKYHPDKVQHLGREFQEIAAVRSAELTRAYKTLTDEAARAEYDEGRGDAPPPGRPSSPKPPADTASPGGHRDEPLDTPPRPRPAPRPSEDRAGASELVRKAALIRFRQAIDEEFGRCEGAAVPGFEVGCAPPKGRFWRKVPPRILARFVPQVDAAAISESWTLALRAQRDDQREICVFVMGPAVAPVGQLARAIADEMRKKKTTTVRICVVPVNTRTWSADIPKDAPPAVKSLAARLKSL
jgi:curved DNA-binding protein CbpA